MDTKPPKYLFKASSVISAPNFYIKTLSKVAFIVLKLM